MYVIHVPESAKGERRVRQSVCNFSSCQIAAFNWYQELEVICNSCKHTETVSLASDRPKIMTFFL